MDSNKYRYCFVDTSYLVRRNGWVVSKGKTPGEYNYLDIVKMSIQTVNKMARDYGVTADKFIFVFDAWSREYEGYYRSWLIKDIIEYKGSRTFETVEGLKELEASGASEAELRYYADRLYANQQIKDAKKMLMSMGPIGIPSISVESFEFDDLVYMAGVLMVREDKPSVILTKDSDLQYCTTPGLDYFKMPVSGSDPEFITYQEMWDRVPDDLKESLIARSIPDYGSALYYYKALLDSLGEGHNDLKKTKRPRKNANRVLHEILVDDNWDNVVDKDAFLRQLESFKVFEFPKAFEAYQAICSIPQCGHYASTQEFENFCQATGLQGISSEYYQTFLNRLDQKLFSE